MKYTQQTQNSLNRLGESLRILRDLIKRGENAQAIQYMESGDLKERFGDLQNMITLSSTNSLGASGLSNIGNL